MTATHADGAAPSANAAVSDELRLLLARGASPIVVRSPPGAGKTGLVAMAAAHTAAAGDRVTVVTATNNQAAELCTRIRTTAPDVPVVLLLGHKAPIPDAAQDAVDDGQLPVARRLDSLPPGPVVAVSSNAKWSCHPHAPSRPFDLQILEEAFMQSWHTTFPLANLAARHLAVGDPGQTEPFTPVDERRWRGAPLSPLTPTGTALERLPSATVLRLDRSLRLPADTCDVLQPLYPGLPFTGLAAAGQRMLLPTRTPSRDAAAALDALAGRSILARLVPGGPPPALDPELCAHAGDLASALHACGLAAHDPLVDDGPRPARIAVVCARNQQVAWVRSRLAGDAARIVTVDTVNRLQGLEYDVVLAVDPLAGHRRLGPFELEPGRLCVMLSRHRVACLLLTRPDVGHVLDRHVPSSDRALGHDPDREHRGWQAHAAVRRLLGL